ncbi:hypothetical protein ABMA27_014270 [Loxostege sticticalis]|uniref:Uncharacterized protein n=1 Tax=Loxostege sticticalis TaxID=481309 RepID=A0ABR3IDC4_LOXSC
MWAYRRMVSISWIDKVTKDQVVRRVQQKSELLQTIKQRKVGYLGHIIRHDSNELLQLIMMGKVAGKRRIGWRKKLWLQNIRDWTGVSSAAQLFRPTRDREEYAKLTATFASRRGTIRRRRSNFCMKK